PGASVVQQNTGLFHDGFGRACEDNVQNGPKPSVVHARLQARHQRNSPAIRRSRRQRDVEVCRCSWAHSWKLLRQHADDGEAMAIEHYRMTEDTRIAIELPLPPPKG